MSKKQFVLVKDLVKLSVNFANPRHEPYEHRHEVLQFLISNTNLKNLAYDIAKNGVNPLEAFGVYPGPKGEPTVLDGNRRLASLLLIQDPLLAPSKEISFFQELSENAPNLSEEEVTLVNFDSYDEAFLWVQRMHGGDLDGIGRKQWGSVEKTRAFKVTENDLSLSLMDKAKELSPESDFKPSISTVRRFVEKKDFREGYLGITSEKNDSEFISNLSDAEFGKRLVKFIADMNKAKDSNNKPYSRYKSDEVIDYISEALGGSAEQKIHEDNAKSKPKTSLRNSPKNDLIRDYKRYSIPKTGLNFTILNELVRLPNVTPNAAALMCRLFLEMHYRQYYKSFSLGDFPQKAHTSIPNIIKHINQNFPPSDRQIDTAFKQLGKLVSDFELLSPANLGNVAHGSSTVVWNELVSKWHSIEEAVIYLSLLIKQKE